MRKLSIVAITVALAVSGAAYGDGSDQELLDRNRTLDQMRHTQEKLSIQAQMAKAYKDMNDSGFIVDSRGVPLGIGDMERLAIEVRRRGGMQAGQGYNPSAPFGGSDLMPMQDGQNLFGDAGFASPTPAPLPPPVVVQPSGTEAEPVEVVTKPTDREKAQGKKVLRLVEIRGSTAVFFTNEGFKEVTVGESIYEQKLAKVGVDNATLRGKDGSRVVRIDWTKSVRYADD